MATEQLTVTVSEELAAAVKRAAAAAGQSISGFAAAALRLELIAVEAGCLPPAAGRAGGSPPPEYAEVMAVLAQPEDLARHPVLNG
ncbi:ribbon-helix-helix protein, CopG family [Nocardia beijingensis]|uniref:ribbon-helix-helix protein, CopG family n=1 Tax=Nocardia beijingensis TaxID=95162 RepID=UPI00189467B4|nr:ribbon-helix-helix protein, CopG family [Nocardia beijingensis]MBF6469001.1 ribbon-helix-helix protein, CopG family [Nocardia beijingensis]